MDAAAGPKQPACVDRVGRVAGGPHPLDYTSGPLDQTSCPLDQTTHPLDHTSSDRASVPPATGFVKRIEAPSPCTCSCMGLTGEPPCCPLNPNKKKGGLLSCRLVRRSKLLSCCVSACARARVAERLGGSDHVLEARVAAWHFAEPHPLCRVGPHQTAFPVLVSPGLEFV